MPIQWEEIQFIRSRAETFNIQSRMKRKPITYLVIILLILFPWINLLAQDTTKILFIGNSFTYYNSLHSLVKGFLTAANIPAYTYEYAQGGISVGDTIQGNQNHMNNPLVYALIRNTDWDFVLLQDRQSRFIQDSGVFPQESLVIEGHLRIRDSLHYYHPCAKMLWFAGWGLKNGQAPQWPSGISMIDHIAVNYRVLNDTAKDVIAPIGLAWKSAILNNPEIELWDPDWEHPSLAGSFLTAAVVYGVVSQGNPQLLPYSAGLAAQTADLLKSHAWSILDSNYIHHKSNLDGVRTPTITFDGNKLKGPPGGLLYQWFLNNNFLVSTTDSSMIPIQSGTYRLRMLDGQAYWLKSCILEVVVTSTEELVASGKENIIIYPNPATSELWVESAASKDYIEYQIFSGDGKASTYQTLHPSSKHIDISHLSPGIYCLKVFNLQTHSIRLVKFVKI